MCLAHAQGVVHPGFISLCLGACSQGLSDRARAYARGVIVARVKLDRPRPFHWGLCDFARFKIDMPGLFHWGLCDCARGNTQAGS